MIIRDFKITDLDDVVNIEFNSFDDPYPIGILLELYNHGAGFLVAQVGKSVVGYVIFWVKDGFGHIIAIAVDEKFRNMKVGSMLISKVKWIFKCNEINKIRLEVRKSNESAIKFYLKKDFHQIDYIPNYYSDGEDAIIMEYGYSNQ